MKARKGTGRKQGAVKGVPIYKRLSMTPRSVATYHWIQNFEREHGKFPRYCDIGEFLRQYDTVNELAKGVQSENYYTLRNRGINLLEHYLIPNGFVVRENRRLALTEKPMQEVNIVVITDSKIRHGKVSPQQD